MCVDHMQQTTTFLIQPMNRFLLTSGALLCAALGFARFSHAESSTDVVYQLEDFIVSAGPGLRSLSDFAAPINVVTAKELSRQSGGTLGAVLDWQPGVSASSFGAGASRPVLRGFDGPRVRILESGIESIDVSDTSPDHGVAMEPLLTDRIEVLRGPSTLLYGSSAIGGAVNVIGKEMPRQPVAEKGYEGAVESRYDSVSEGETQIGYATVGQEQWAFTVTGLNRDGADYEIPRDARQEGAQGDELENSFVDTQLYSVGASWFFDEDNRIGFAFSNYESNYGVPGHGHHEEEGEDDHDEHEEEGEDDHNEHEEEASVAIDMDRKRYDMELELVEPAEWIDALRVRLGYTDYEHRELEGGETGTMFEREGWELRTEVAHSPWWWIDEGVVGIQVSDTDFSAIGDEAFTPPSKSANQAIFLNEQIHGEVLRYEFGGRVERSDISAEGATSDYNELAFSIAAGATWQIDLQNALSLVLQRSQRHPNPTELYADGAHFATRQYEIGDADLEKETAYGVDLTYRSTHEQWQAEISIFYTYFEDYIFAENLGFETNELDTYQFSAIDAEFYGYEAQLDYELFSSNDSTVVLSLMNDAVRARNKDSGDDLPRVPPLRIGSRLGFNHRNWESGVELRYAFEQTDTAPEETETDAYTQLNADLSCRFELSDGLVAVIFLRADNLLNEEIRNHSSFLKDEAPLPGRNFTVGGRFEF